ncbi:hypothetical protein MRX96_033139 [Rhipicephalus microplus]
MPGKAAVSRAMMALIRSRRRAVALKPAPPRPRGSHGWSRCREGEEQKVPDPETGEELAELLVDEAHFLPLNVGNAPPLDTGITP